MRDGVGGRLRQIELRIEHVSRAGLKVDANLRSTSSTFHYFILPLPFVLFLVKTIRESVTNTLIPGPSPFKGEGSKQLQACGWFADLPLGGRKRQLSKTLPSLPFVLFVPLVPFVVHSFLVNPSFAKYRFKHHRIIGIIDLACTPEVLDRSGLVITLAGVGGSCVHRRRIKLDLLEPHRSREWLAEPRLCSTLSSLNSRTQ
ncbi:MAG: hypothetical protein RIS70_313 [Planctomycetota bacterium]